MDIVDICKKEPKEVFKVLNSSEHGLDEEEAEKRLKKFGKNELKKRTKTALMLFLSQFKSPLVFLLFIAAVISYFLHEETSTVIILGIIVLNGILSFIQEYKSQKATEKLEKMISYTAKVKRSNKWKEIPVSELTLGDVVRLEIGDRVPADLRLFELNNLLINESIISGEAFPIAKTTKTIEKAGAVHEMTNIAFMGTVVSNGEGLGIVAAKGEDTFFGKTAKLIEKSDEKSEFEKNIEMFNIQLIKIVIVSIILIFALNVFLDKGLSHSLLFAIALAVAIIPEALPIIITLSLSWGSIALSKQGVIVKKLSVIEDLGNVDILCTDKTGTLTENIIKVHDFFDENNKKNKKIMEYAILCTSTIDYDGKIRGNPIDVAIANYEKPIPHKHIFNIPFDYERRRMSTVVEIKNERLLITKGSVETMLDICTVKNRKKLMQKHAELGEQGYRAIAIGYKKIKQKPTYEKQDEQNLTFLGFILFLDPPKKTIKKSLDIAKKLGVAIKLITGDSVAVAKNIAKQTGFEFNENQIIDGNELDLISKNNEKLKQTVENCIIFARISPIQKHLIVKTLKANGHVIAFLGDGVNDAPSLKEADVGISVNNAADVTKETADIVLMRKSINSIVQGISGGRKIFSNIIKYIVVSMAGNFGNMYMVGIASMFLKFIPLKPVQILLANFVTDAPMVSISTDNVDDEELLKPKKWDVKEIIKFGGILGMVSAFFGLFLIIFLINQPEAVFQTALYAQIILTEILVIMSLRTSNIFFKAEPLSPMLFVTTVLSILIGIGLIYTPIAAFFNFVPLPLGILSIVLGVTFMHFVCAEIVKLVYKKTFYKAMIVDKKALALLREEIVPELH